MKKYLVFIYTLIGFVAFAQKTHTVAKGDTPYNISKKYGVSTSKLMKWNELSSQTLKEGQILFLEKKNSSGSVETYRAEKGDNMYSIAQKFAIRLDKLYDKNRMEYGDKVKEGQLIYLKNRKPR